MSRDGEIDGSSQVAAVAAKPKNLAICMALVLGAALIANLNVLLGDFIWDDTLLIVGNSSIKHLSNIPIFFRQPYYGIYYRPIVILSYALEYAVWGLNPFGFHLTNLLLHGVNALLVFAFLKAIRCSERCALIGAILFGAHPALKAVVAVSDRTGLLATFFFLSSLLLFVRHRAAPRGAGLVLQYLAALFLFGLGLLSKEEALILLLVLVMIDVLISGNAKGLSNAVKVVSYVPFILLVVLFFWLRATVIEPEIGLLSAFAIEPLRRFLTLPFLLMGYLGVLVYPFHIDYDPRIPLAAGVTEPRILAGIVLFAVTLIAIPVFYRRSKAAAFGLLWYYVVFIPSSNLLPIYPEVAQTEVTNPVRYLYLPSVGIFLCAAYFFESVANGFTGERRSILCRRLMYVSLCCMVFLFSVLSMNRNILWKDEATFYRYGVKMNPRNARMRLNLGTIYLGRGQLDEALRELSEAVLLTPDNPIVRNNLGLVYKAKGWFPRAEEEFRRAIQLDPKSAMAYANLAAVYQVEGKLPEAIEAGTRAVELAPDSITAQLSLAAAYKDAGALDDAEAHYQAVIRLNPDSAEAHSGLGSVYARRGDNDSARKEWEETLRIEPGLTEVRENLQRLKNED